MVAEALKVDESTVESLRVRGKGDLQQDREERPTF